MHASPSFGIITVLIPVLSPEISSLLGAGERTVKAVVRAANSLPPFGNCAEHVTCRCYRESFREAVSIHENRREGN
jgi:hypothetical protein